MLNIYPYSFMPLMCIFSDNLHPNNQSHSQKNLQMTKKKKSQLEKQKESHQTMVSVTWELETGTHSAEHCDKSQQAQHNDKYNLFLVIHIDINLQVFFRLTLYIDDFFF